MSKTPPRAAQLSAVAACALFAIYFMGVRQGGLSAPRTGSMFFESAWIVPGSGAGLSSDTATVGAGGSSDAGAELEHAWQEEEQQRRQQLDMSCPSSQEVAESRWASSCYLVTKVCVDQGGLVLYDDRYQPGRRGGGEKAPTFAAEDNYGQYIYVYRNGYAEFDFPLASIRSRGVSLNEGADYLRAPLFSNCTVPVVWYPFWMNNFGHFLRDNCAKLFGFIQDTPWARSIKLVPVTAEGLALPGFNYQLLQAMSPLRVETWADFSTRLPPGGASLVQPGPPPSAEGDHQRCFERMFICTHGLNITRWPLHGFGRHLVQAYRHLLPAEALALVDSPSSVVAAQQQQQQQRQRQQGAAGSASGTTAAGVAGADAGAAATHTMLNVVFQRRKGDTRQVLNIEELLQHCNEWRHTTAAGHTFGFKCWEMEITDLASGMAAAQLADVMVGVHGANLANGWLMRPGSSMVEIQAYGFDAHTPHLQDPLFNAEDTESEVLWWVLQGCDPGAWQPSPAEAERKAGESNWVKNRNLVVRWEALQTALRQVAETGGDMQRYRQLWKSGEWWWHVNPHNITHGGHHRSRCAF